MGVTNNKSIATGIAQAMRDEDIFFIYTYPNASVQKLMTSTVTKMHESNNDMQKEFETYKCDVSSDEDIDSLMQHISNKHGQIDYLVHSIAYADKTYLNQLDYHAVTREAFKAALDISCYSLTGLIKAAMKYRILVPESSILTISYYGGQKCIPYYNVMGVAKAALECSVMYLANDLGKHDIRINAISAGPVKTLSGQAIKNFNALGHWVEKNSPLGRLATINQIGEFAVSIMNSNIVTGYTFPADCGYQIMGITPKDPYKTQSDTDNQTATT